MKERYPLVSGALPVPITVSYTYGDSYISLSSLNYIPSAPNLITLIDGDGFSLTVEYTEITGNSLTGLRYIEGNIEHTFIANKASAVRAITAYDFEAINEHVDTKVDKVEGKGLTAEEYTLAEKLKLAAIEDGAQVNILETISLNGTAFPIVSKNIDLPLASASTVGLAKFGNGLTVSSDGTVSTTPLAGTGISVIEIDGVAVPCLNNVAAFPLVSTTVNGAMTSADKIKIDTVEEGAEANKLNGVKVNNSELTITDKKVNIELKTVGGCSLIGTGDIPVKTGEIPTIIGNSLVFTDENNPFISGDTLVFS